MWFLHPPKSRRRWHVFTWLAAVPALGFVALVQVAGLERSSNGLGTLMLEFEHGWPTPWLERTLTYEQWILLAGRAKAAPLTRNTGDGHSLNDPWQYRDADISWTRPQAWPGYANQSTWHPGGLVLNLLVAACVIAAPMAATEFWLRRRRGPFRVKIIDFLAVSFLMACGFGFWRWDQSAFQREKEVWLRGTTQYAKRYLNCEMQLGYAGPEWLARLYGNGDAVPVFQRITSLALRAPTPGDIQRFQDLQSLRVAHVDMGQGRNPAVLQALASNKSLRELSLTLDRDDRITHNSMEALLEFRRLEKVDLEASPLVDDLLRMKSLRRLRELSFCADMVTAEQLADVEEALSRVKIKTTRTSRSETLLQPEYIALARLNCRCDSHCELTADGQFLRWKQAPFTAENLEPLARVIPTLRVLEIKDPGWSLAELPDLSRFHDLTNVILWTSDLPVEFMDQIADLPNLVKVSIYRRPATLEPLLALKRRPPRILYIASSSDFSDEEIEALRRAFGDRLEMPQR